MDTIADNPRKMEHFCYSAVQTGGNAWNFDFENQLAVAQVREKGNWKQKTLNQTSLIAPFTEEYQAARERIQEICTASDKDALAPNEVAKQLALSTLTLLEENNVIPSLINSSHDQSIIFEFFTDEDVYSIDLCNSGDVVYLRQLKGQIVRVEEVSAAQIRKIVLEISRAYANV